MNTKAKFTTCSFIVGQGTLPRSFKTPVTENWNNYITLMSWLESHWFKERIFQRKNITRYHKIHKVYCNNLDTHTYTRLTALFPGLPRWARTRKVKPIWILLKQETVSGSGISWAICKSAPCSRQTTTPTPHHSVFYRPNVLPAAQPTVSKHWRHHLILNR